MNTLLTIGALAVAASATQLNAEVEEFIPENAEDYYNLDTLNDMEEAIWNYYSTSS
jgi:hypothetical protein